MCMGDWIGHPDAILRIFGILEKYKEASCLSNQSFNKCKKIIFFSKNFGNLLSMGFEPVINKCQSALISKSSSCQSLRLILHKIPSSWCPGSNPKKIFFFFHRPSSSKSSFCATQKHIDHKHRKIYWKELKLGKRISSFLLSWTIDILKRMTNGQEKYSVFNLCNFFFIFSLEM